MDMQRDDAQLDLFGRRPPRERQSRGDAEHRYYFSLQPPPALAQEIEREAEIRARRFNTRSYTRAARLHVSLNGVHGGGPLDADDIDDLLSVGSAMRRASFDLTFDRVQTFSKPADAPQFPIVLASSQDNRDLQRLYLDIYRTMQSHGLPAVGPKTITPHLTTFYAKDRVPEIILPRPVRWRVDKFWLLHTIRGHQTPETLGEWPLDGF